jgi:hypothetical protein
MPAARGIVAGKPDNWYCGSMKTTLGFPDDLMRAVKIRAVQDNRNIKDSIADLLRRGLAQPARATPTVRQRVRRPLVECAHEARRGGEMPPERVAEILIQEEGQSVARATAADHR